MPSAYDQLIAQLGRLPGVGPRSAERIALHLLKQPGEETAALTQALERFRSDLKVCSICGHVSESDPCPICQDMTRDRSIVMVVEQPTDVLTMEQTRSYRGLYHVLMGRLAPLEAIGAGELNIDPLIDRIEQGEIKEVVLGTNPTLEGDGTAMLLHERLQQPGLTVTRLSRGLPTGTSLQRLSKAVLSDAFTSRTSMR